MELGVTGDARAVRCTMYALLNLDIPMAVISPSVKWQKLVSEEIKAPQYHHQDQEKRRQLQETNNT